MSTTWQKFYLSDPFAGVELIDDDLQGWGSDDHIFGQIIAKVKPRLIIEVGSWKGRSAINMVNLCRQHGIEPTVICVDTWLGSFETYADHDGKNKGMHQSLRLHQGYPQLHKLFMSNVVRHGMQGNIIPFALPSLEAARVLYTKDVQADLIYIDASHHYHDCAFDLRDYWPLLRYEGIMFGDDYGTWPGVTQAVDEFVESRGLQSRAVRRGGKFAIGRGCDMEGIT
jgi:predicted O-methyltransferase YrrM